MTKSIDKNTNLQSDRAGYWLIIRVQQKALLSRVRPLPFSVFLAVFQGL